jgi:quercetin dioxygenase-like cupin family protein
MLKTLALTIAIGLAAMTTAQAQGIKRTILQKVDVAGTAFESVVGVAEVPAGVMIGLHTHPGTEQGMVIEGELALAVDGQPEKTLKAGDSYTIPAGVPHDGKAGGSGVKGIATYVVEKGKPMASAFKR